MADQIAKINYYITTIPNKPGEGARILSALKEAGVNLTVFLGYRKTARNAEIVLVESSGPIAQAARKAGLALGKKQPGLYITGEDRPGAVAEALAKLAEKGVNVTSCHAMAAGEGRYGAMLVVDAADMRKATKALGV